MELRKNAKNDFAKDFFKLMSNAAERIRENVRKYRDIKLVATEARNKYLISQPNYYTIIFFLKIY